MITMIVSIIVMVLLVYIIGIKLSEEKAPILETGAYTLQYPMNFGSRFHIPDDNPMTKEGVALGRMLFYEPKLSANNTISCASCHRQKLAFTDGRTFSLGVDGQPTSRNSMSLGNILWVRHLFWDGRANSLEEQALFPMTDPHEMGQSLDISREKLQKSKIYPPLFKTVFNTDKITADLIVKAIAQFERTLISSNAPYDQYLNGTYTPSPDELGGMQLFMNAPDPKEGKRGANCIQCHGGPKTYLELFHNNGLDSIPMDLGREKITHYKMDKGRFRVPTLRNIEVTGPYMHDGRFKTLREVLDHYSDHIKESETLSPVLRNTSNLPNGQQLGLTSKEKNEIITFLMMLTDSSFLHNPNFSKPHN